MTRERIYSIAVEVVERPGEQCPVARTVTVRYCDDCQRWGMQGAVHICRENWSGRLSDLLALMGEEVSP